MAYQVRPLAKEELARWDTLLTHSPQRTIFGERWWIDLVTHGQGQLLGCFSGDELVAGLPIWPVTAYGVRRLRQPVFTPYWGPVIDGARQYVNYYTRHSTEADALLAFADYLRAWPDSTLQFHPTLVNWMPFYWRGYRQATRYTYRIGGLAEYRAAKPHRLIYRTLQRAAKHDLRVMPDPDPALVSRLAEQSVTFQGGHVMAEQARMWPRLWEAARARGCAYACVITAPDGTPHAAGGIVWDARCAYFIIGGSDPRYRPHGAWTLINSHMIEQAAEHVATFDFEGTMLEPVEPFIRRYGGELTPYLHISRAASWPLNGARWMMAALRRPRGRRPVSGDE